MVAAQPTVDAAALTLLARIADAGSLSAAARALGLTQPALTKQLSRIERQLGVTLFARSIRGVRPTDYGCALLPRGRIVQAQLAQAAEDIAQLRGRREGQVSVALSHLATVSLLPSVLPPFRAGWPGVTLRILPPAFPQRFAGLREGSPDFAVEQLPGQPLGAEFQVRVLAAASIVGVVRAGHPLARATTLAQLAGAEWVMPSADSATASAVAAAFERARLAPPVSRVHCETLTGVEAIVGSTDLIAAMPDEVYESRARASGLVRLPLVVAPRANSLAIIRWADAKPTPAAQELAELFVAQAQIQARSRRRRP